MINPMNMWLDNNEWLDNNGKPMFDVGDKVIVTSYSGEKHHGVFVGYEDNYYWAIIKIDDFKDLPNVRLSRGFAKIEKEKA